MAYLDRDEVKQVVIVSLKVVADIPQGNIDNTPLNMLNDIQIQTFLSTLKTNINAVPYHLRDGTVADIAYYDVPLTTDTFNSWKTVGGCIDWITANQIIVGKTN